MLDEEVDRPGRRRKGGNPEKRGGPTKMYDWQNYLLLELTFDLLYYQYSQQIQYGTIA